MAGVRPNRRRAVAAGALVDARLRRTSSPARWVCPGILEDYAALTQACVRLAAATAEPMWLERARELYAVIASQFDDGKGGFFDTAADAERLYARPQDPTDNATPSGLSATVHALRLLSELTGEDAYADRAMRAAATAGQLVVQAPRFAGWLLADAISYTGNARRCKWRSWEQRRPGSRRTRPDGLPGSACRLGDPGRRARGGGFRVAGRPAADRRPPDGLRLPALRLQASGHFNR